MAGWVEPAYSSSRVKAAGKRIRASTATVEDWEVFENWRRSHAYVLNTFQMRLRHTRDKFPGDVQVAQRTKRRPTVVDKLGREPNMQLSTMHDIAGCRAICSDITELYNFRDAFLNTRAKHIHVNRGQNHFDYIRQPKRSGYRGIHEVFRTELISDSGRKWNGLKVEIQFRTRAQHAWATAVETIDLLNGERAKFGQASGDLQRFFVLASEIIARAHEDRKSTLSSFSDQDIAAQFSELDQNLGVVRRLTDAVAESPNIPRNRHTILIFQFSGIKRLLVETYDSLASAQTAYERLEREREGSADVVLVRAERAEDLKRAFQNYFTDASDFVDLVVEGRKRLA